MAEHRGLAITALALGIVGLFTAGLLVVGSLVGLALAGAVLARAPARDRDVAWAALAANVFALFTILPLGGALFAYRATVGPLPLVDPQPLPEVAAPSGMGEELELAVPPPPPPPPPPPSTRPATGPRGTPRTADEPGSSQASSAAPPTARPGAEGGEAPDPSSLAPVRVGGQIEPPRKTHNVNPVYPQAAKRKRVEGVVILECTISPQGKVVEVKVLRSIPLLDQAAIDAVEQWEYSPTLLNGVPVPVIMTVTLNFKLS
jgi:protein TonB